MSDALPCTAADDELLKHGHLSYHFNLMRKISISKIDTTLAFGFYLKNYEDFKLFQDFLLEKQVVYKDNWLFSHYDSKPK